MNSGAPEGFSSFSTASSDMRHITVKQHEYPLIWYSCWTPVSLSKHN